MNAVDNAHAWLHGDIDTDPRQLIKALLAVIETRAVPAGGCAPPVYVGELPAFQHRVFPWLIECFGPKVAADVTERCDRFIEEAFELVQSLGYDAVRVDALKAYTWGRPPGEPTQEVGGVMVTLGALCGAAGLDMHEAGETELARINVPAVLEKIRAKQAAKARDIPFSPLPQLPGREARARELLAAEFPGDQCAFMRTLICDPLIAQRGVVETSVAIRAIERALSQPAPTARGWEELRAEIDRLNVIINTPQADDFLLAVSTEAEHQRQRWGNDHDSGKSAADWFWLIGYLAGKALHSTMGGLDQKAEHHVITTAAACANWHRAMKGKTDMRPGIDGEAALAGADLESASG